MDTKTRILIVDDEPAIRRLLLRALRPTGREVEAVESAEEALGRIQVQPFNLLIVDKNLPGMSGVELIRELRKQDQDAGVIMITAYPTVQSAIQTLECDIDEYIEKPFNDVAATFLRGRH